MITDKRSFAPVAPVKILRHLMHEYALPHYNLVLAHNVVAQSYNFQKLVDGRSDNWGTWLIDNSVIELGKPVDASMIADAQSILLGKRYSPASEYVCILPDALLDCDETIKVTKRALVDFRRLKIDNLMFVPQGKNLEEVIRCAEYFRSVEEIRWIGVAKNFVSVLGTRRLITPILQSIFPKAKFHMLGFSRDTVDDILSTRLPGVEGIDSSMPLRCSEPISFNSQFSKRGDWWDEELEYTALMAHNVREVNRWLGS